MEQENVVAYCRVSTQTQVKKGEGLEIQHRKISEFCDEKCLRLGKIYEDKGISGAVKDRPALLQLLKDCENGKVKKVIIYKHDRLSRELTIALWLETQFKKYDVEVVSVVDPEYDLDDPLQKAFKRIADVFAELEKDVIATRLKEGRINNAKNGKRGCGPIPFGYQKVGDNLEVNPDEAPHVIKIFRWFVKGHRYSEIAEILNKRNICTKRGRLFQIQSIKSILSNGTYCGQMTFGTITSIGVHQKLISKRLYAKAQERMTNNR